MSTYVIIIVAVNSLILEYLYLVEFKLEWTWTLTLVFCNCAEDVVPRNQHRCLLLPSGASINNIQVNFRLINISAPIYLYIFDERLFLIKKTQRKNRKNPFCINLLRRFEQVNSLRYEWKGLTKPFCIHPLLVIKQQNIIQDLRFIKQKVGQCIKLTAIAYKRGTANGPIAFLSKQGAAKTIANICSMSVPYQAD